MFIITKNSAWTCRYGL